jgi:glycosyltransferase involved in cell wall biosynthesis
MPKITIIIPVYNRVHLLPFTLKSIIAQSFTDWECVLIDDKSSDASFAVMEAYQKKDQRIKAHRRPIELKKGANSCRNYGFLKASGDFIKWFDSDDIMLPNHLSIAYHTLVGHNLDFVVTDTLNFDNDTNEFLGMPYNFDKSKVFFSPKNFALNRIGWITDDFLGTREIVKNIKFNEDIVDGDEYNFFIKLLHQPFKGVFIEEVLTHRRIHEQTLSVQNRKTESNYHFVIADLKYQTAQDLVVYNNIELIRWFLSGYMQYSFSLAKEKNTIPYKHSAFKLICNYYSNTKASAFIIALFFARYFNKGYNIIKYART